MAARPKTSAIETIDLYRLALHASMDIQRQLDERSVDATAQTRSTKYVREEKIYRSGFPHQCLNFDGEVNTDRKEAWQNAADLDKEIAADLKAATQSPSLSASFAQPEKRGPVARLLTGLAGRFIDKAGPESTQSLLSRREEMLHVLRVLKVAQTGVAPVDNGKSYGNGYLTPKIDRLTMSDYPKTHQAWSDVASQTLDAMKPRSVDECVIDYKLGSGPDTHNGITLMTWGGNTEYGVSDEQKWSLQIRQYYGRKMISFDSREDATRAFSSLLTAKDSNAVHEVLGDKVSGYKDVPVQVRHTSAGNFTGGSFQSDKAHPNAIVRAAHMQQGM